MVKLMQNDTQECITNFLFIGKPFEELTHYDLVIILGNDYYKETALTLKKLLEENKITSDTKIIISGNKGTLNKTITDTEAEIIYHHLRDFGLDLNCELEKHATNIKENLLYSKEIIKDFNLYSQILVIGKSFVGRRVLMCLDALDYPLSKIDYYGLESDITKSNWSTTPTYQNRILEELERISIYTKNKDLKL